MTDSAVAVLSAVCRRIGGFHLVFDHVLAGAAYFASSGKDIEPGAEKSIGQADAMFLGAIGLPTIRNRDGTEISPHLRLRERYQLYAGVRPVKAYSNIPRRLADYRSDDIDMVILRESTEGLFFSAAAHQRDNVNNDSEVRETLRITRAVTEKLHDFAFTLARKRKSRGGKGRVTCVDKSNVFRSMAFFRQIFDERSVAYPDIEKSYAYVDAQALNLVRQPWDIDVMVMENMFGDILSDLAGGLVGGLGMAACGEIGDNHGLFQPAHGSAPDIMGQDKANPLAAILSAALLLEYLFEQSGHCALEDAAALIERVVASGFTENRLRPMELGGNQGTREVSSTIIELLNES